MTRHLLLALLLLCAPHSALATTSYWFGNFGTTPNTAAARYSLPNNLGPTAGVSANETNSAGVAPTSFTVKRFWIIVSVAPDNGGGTQSWTLTMRDNLAGSNLSCVISEAATSCNDTDDVTYTASERISIEISPTGTPAATVMSWIVEYDTATSGETVGFCSTFGNLATGATDFMNVWWLGASATESSRYIVSPGAFTIKNLYMRLNTTPGGTASRTFTVFKNGGSTAITILFDNDDVGIESDTSNTVSIAAGDTFSIQATVANTPAASPAECGVVFLAGTPGQFIIPAISNANLSTSAVRYIPLAGEGLNATETAVQDLAQNLFQITHVRIVLSGAPANGGGTQAYDFLLRENAGDASVTFAVNIQEAGTTGNASGTFTPAANGLLDTQVTPSGTPTARTVALSYLGVVTVGSAGGSCIVGGGLIC